MLLFIREYYIYCISHATLPLKNCVNVKQILHSTLNASLCPYNHVAYLIIVYLTNKSGQKTKINSLSTQCISLFCKNDNLETSMP